jgi:hypothetical protein
MEQAAVAERRPSRSAGCTAPVARVPWATGTLKHGVYSTKAVEMRRIVRELSGRPQGLVSAEFGSIQCERVGSSLVCAAGTTNALSR